MNKRRKTRSNRDRTGPLLSRRELLQQAVNTGVLATGIAAVGWLAYSDEPILRPPRQVYDWRDYQVPADPHLPRLAVARGSDVERMARAAVARLGGMGRFIQKGERVLIKPNVGWDRQPEQAANTGPELVGAMVRLCREAGAGAVWVSDVSINDPARCFARSGIEAAVVAAGGVVRHPRAEAFVPTRMGGRLLQEWPVLRYFHEADRVINLPIVKHHSLSRCTLAMKNWYGVIGGQRNQLHQDIHTSIADLAGAVRPTLTVMDATRILMRNGPTGGSLSDVAPGNTIIASLDEVALDSYALQFLDLTVDEVPYLALGEQRQLGTTRWRDLHWVEERVG